MMLLILLLSLFGILLVFIGYPLLLFVIARVRPDPYRIDDSQTPSVTLIVACHNPGALLQRKVDNSLALDYPPQQLSLLIVSDGSIDGTATLLQTLKTEQVRGIAF